VKKLLTNIWLWIILILLLVCCGVKWYIDRDKNYYVEERTVYVVSPEYLRPYKEECIAEGGTFCAKRIDAEAYTGANAYSDTLDTTGYLLSCRKKRAIEKEEACVNIP
jgi:hypothetical protein